MSWDELDSGLTDAEVKQRQKERHAEAVSLAKAYFRCFSTEDGNRVINDLVKRFVMENGTSLTANNVNYEAAYHNGEAGTVHFILHQMKHAELQ